MKELTIRSGAFLPDPGQDGHGATRGIEIFEDGERLLDVRRLVLTLEAGSPAIIEMERYVLGSVEVDVVPGQVCG